MAALHGGKARLPPCFFYLPLFENFTSVKIASYGFYTLPLMRFKKFAPLNFKLCHCLNSEFNGWMNGFFWNKIYLLINRYWLFIDMHRAKKSNKVIFIFNFIWSWWLWWQELRSWGSYRSRAAASCGSSKRHNITCNGWYWSDLFCTEASGYPWFRHSCWSMYRNVCWYDGPVEKRSWCRSSGEVCGRSNSGFTSSCSGHLWPTNWPGSGRSHNRYFWIGDKISPTTRICPMIILWISNWSGRCQSRVIGGIGINGGGSDEWAWGDDVTGGNVTTGFFITIGADVAIEVDVTIGIGVTSGLERIDGLLQADSSEMLSLSILFTRVFFKKANQNDNEDSSENWTCWNPNTNYS